MTKLELMAVMHSLEALHLDGKPDTALAVIQKIIAEAGGNVGKGSNGDSDSSED